ncbi:YggT family protein [Collimonas sp. OK242]|nr:YggT family protein [Collimonas sp. OK242]
MNRHALMCASLSHCFIWKGKHVVLQNIFTLIIETIASVLGGVLLLRFWIQAVRVRPPQQLAQFIFTLSDWAVRPMRRLLPGLGGYDWASLIGALLVAVICILLELGVRSALNATLIFSLSALLFFQWVFYGLIALLIIEAIFSWVNPHAPLAPFVRALNEPLLRPLRRIIPLIGNIDLSPLAALILLRVVHQLVIYLIMSLT